MAYRIGNISPLDLSSGRTAVGVGFPFSGNAVFNSTYSTVDAYRTNLMMYFLTDKGERYYDPEFGNDFKRLLFEQPLSDARKQEIRANFQEDLAFYFPKLVLDEFSLEQYDDEQTIQLYIKLHVNNTQQNFDLTVNF